MALKPDIESMIQDTVEGVLNGDGTALEAETTPEAPPAEAAAAAAVPPEVTPEAQAATPAETPNGTADVPTEYFGVDLSGLEPEKRLAIIENFKQQDRTINRLMQTQAQATPAEPAAPEPTQQVRVEEPAPSAPPSDEAIMQALGYSPDDPMYEVKAEVALPLARTLARVEQTLNGIVYERELEATAQHWHDTVTRLEQEHGVTLPDRAQFFQYAADNAIFDPEVAFYKLVSPAQRELSQQASTARAAALEELRARKQDASTTRPRSNPPTGAPPIEAKSLKEGVLLAAKQAADEAGLDWGAALRSA